MSINGKIKTIDNKVEQNKAQYNLDRQTAKISALSSGNVSKYEFLTGKDVLPEKDLLEKAVTMKRFEYSPFSKELKAQADTAKKHYQKLDDTYEFDEISKEEKLEYKKYNSKNLVYNSKHSFCGYCNNKKFNSLPIKLKYLILLSFFVDLNKLSNIIPQKESRKEKQETVYNNAAELYNVYLKIYFNE